MKLYETDEIESLFSENHNPLQNLVIIVDSAQVYIHIYYYRGSDCWLKLETNFHSFEGCVWLGPVSSLSLLERVHQLFLSSACTDY